MEDLRPDRAGCVGLALLVIAIASHFSDFLVGAAILAIGHGGSHGALYTVAGFRAITGAAAILPLLRIR
jgi:hypothetical protein